MNVTDQDQFDLQSHTNAIQACAEALVTALNRAHKFVWGLPDDRIAGLLAAIGPAKVGAIMGSHNVLALAANTALAAAGSESRASDRAGAEIAFDGTAWTVTRPQSEPT